MMRTLLRGGLVAALVFLGLGTGQTAAAATPTGPYPDCSVQSFCLYENFDGNANQPGWKWSSNSEPGFSDLRSGEYNNGASSITNNPSAGGRAVGLHRGERLLAGHLVVQPR